MLRAVTPHMEAVRNTLLVKQARGVFGTEVFETVIPRAVRLAEAPSHGKSIFHYEPNGKAATAYGALADEVIRRGEVRARVAS